MISVIASAALCLSTPPTPRNAPLGRRALIGSAAAAVVLPTRAAHAESLKTYTDERYGVSIGLPDGWTAVPNQLGDGRRLVLATDPNDESTNVFIAFTPIRPDYSSLGSFGTIDYVASTVIPQCGANGECRFSNGDAIEGKMISQGLVKGNYFYDYTIEQKGGPKRRLQSLFSIQADGASSILVGVNAQCIDSKHAALASTFKDVINSYKGK